MISRKLELKLELNLEEFQDLLEFKTVNVDGNKVDLQKHIEGIVEYDEVDDNHYAEDLVIVQCNNKLYANIALSSGTCRDDMSWDDAYIDFHPFTVPEAKKFEKVYTQKEKLKNENNKSNRSSRIRCL